MEANVERNKATIQESSTEESGSEQASKRASEREGEELNKQAAGCLEAAGCSAEAKLVEKSGEPDIFGFPSAEARVSLNPVKMHTRTGKNIF